MLNLEALQAKYPFLTIFYYGTSVLGKRIPYIKLGNGTKEVFYNATIHANEWINSVFFMKWIENFCEAYSQGKDWQGYNLQEIWNTTTIYLAPMLNPDGVDLVTGVMNQNLPSYQEAVRIAEDYPNIPFPNGWKANIRGGDFEKYHPLKCSNHPYLRAFLGIEMLLFFRFSISIMTTLISNIKIVKNIQNKYD